jgi:hypothetical protein
LTLPPIPFIRVGAGGPLALLEAEHARAEAMLAIVHRRFGRLPFRVGDRISRAWLKRTDMPYREEILAVANRIGMPGAIMLNLSYEWACTTGTAADPARPGQRMLRVLDWPLPGLGRFVVVAEEDGPRGIFHNVTWPGAVGVLTASAPRRFALAINQGPMTRRGLGLVGDWAVDRLRLWRRPGLPPAQLARQVCLHARDYDQALAMLRDTPIALPTLFILAGTKAGQGCVIERGVHAHVTQAPITCANTWLGLSPHGRPRGRDNDGRMRLLADRLVGGDGFGWLGPPVLNRWTRLAVSANPLVGDLAVLGYEGMRPATAEFRLLEKQLTAASGA